MDKLVNVIRGLTYTFRSTIMVSDQVKGESKMAKTKKRFGRDKAHAQGFEAKRTFEIDLATMFDRHDAEQHLQDLLDIILGIDDSEVRSRLFGTDRKGV